MFTAALIAGAVAAVGGVAAAAISSASQKKINEQNEQRIQAENQTTREREDNAVQRRVADLRLAGLSPTLAAGSAASAQAGQVYQQNNNPIGEIAQAAGQAPETMLNAISAASNISAQQQSIAQSKAQASLIEAQTAGQRFKNQLEATFGYQEMLDKHLISQAQYDSLVASTKNNILNNAIIEKFGMDSARYDLNLKQNEFALQKRESQYYNDTYGYRVQQEKSKQHAAKRSNVYGYIPFANWITGNVSGSLLKGLLP